MSHELEAALDAALAEQRMAERQLNALRTAKSDEKKQRLAEFTGALEVELSQKHDAEIQLASATASEKGKQTDAASVARGNHKMAGMGDPRRVLWEKVGGRFGTPQTYTKTDATARLEVCMPESKFPENQRWNLPYVGDVFIRLNRRDGSPSAKFISLRAAEAGNWKPLDWAPTERAQS